MKLHRILLLMFVLVCLGSCKDTDTQAFSQLVKTFGITIPNNPHTFVVIPINSCTGCVKLAWDVLESESENDPSKEITVIDAYRSGKDPFRKDVVFPVYIDSTYIIEGSPMNLSNPTVIRTEKRRVKSIVSAPTNRVKETLIEQINGTVVEPPKEKD